MDKVNFAKARAAAHQLLQALDPVPNRTGLDETPRRVADYWMEMTSGHAIDIPSLFKTFEEDAGGNQDLVIVSGINFVSTCSHHLALFHGTASVGYIPKDRRIIGLSKIARLVDAFARRLQTQEKITAQVADSMMEYLQPIGVMVVLRATHTCMLARGPRSVAQTTTSAVRGAFENDMAARAEFLSLMNTK